MAQEERTSSKLIGKLQGISRGVAAPIGFGRYPAQPLPAMLLLASLPRNEAALAEAAVTTGADALVGYLHEGQGDARFGGISEERSNLQAVLKVAGDRPVGVAIGGNGAITADELRDLAGMGVDFVAVAPHRAPAALLRLEEVGHVARLDGDHPGGLLRGLNELNVDAVQLTLGRPDGSLAQLTIHDLASLRQLLDAVRRPILLPTAWAAQPADLAFLRDLGVEGLVLTRELLGDRPEDVRARVAEYRQAVDKLGPPVGRGRALGGRRVVLPRVTVRPEAEEEDDEED